MTASILGRSARVSAGAIVALWAWGLVAPTGARAGCARDFHTRAVVDAVDRLSSPTSGLGADLDPGSNPDRPEPPRPRRCAGPTCSGDVPGPTAPPAMSFERAADPWACLMSCPRSPGSGSALLPPPSGDRAPAGPVAAIFHPPRPGRIAPAA